MKCPRQQQQQKLLGTSPTAIGFRLNEDYVSRIKNQFGLKVFQLDQRPIVGVNC